MRNFAAIVVLIIFATIPAQAVKAGAYVVSGNNNGAFMEYADMEIYFPSSWAAENVKLAERLGIGYAGRNERYNRQLTRKELAYVTANLYKVIGGSDSLTLTNDDLNKISAQYTDSYIGGKVFDDEVFLAIKYNLMNGTATDKFSPDSPATREQTAAVLFRIVERFMDMSGEPRADLLAYTDYDKISPYAVDYFSTMIGAGVLSGVSADKLAPKNICTYEEVLTIAVRLLKAFENDMGVELIPYYSAILGAPTVVNVHSQEIDYQGKKTEILDAEWLENEGALGYAVDCVKPDGTVLRTVTTNTGVTIFESDVYDSIEVYSIGANGIAGIIGEYGSSLMNPVSEDFSDYTAIYEYNDYTALLSAIAEDEHLSSYPAASSSATNPKNITLKNYSSNGEAIADMTEITVRIWKMGANNTRVAGTADIYVNRSVAQDVIDIFEDIYNGPEQFPIYNVSGYSWRGAGSKSAHLQGLAIDINPDHNYFINTRGSILAGKMWSPALSPYSIKPDGDVVRAFNKKGWFWGGIGWSTTGKDYMHLSYTGT